jgi:predicted metal-dependent phosphoesterase TrpH
MMQWLRADLHVHTLLSPCAAIEMTPRNIIRHAVMAGVDIVAITDHNAGDNVAATLRAAAGTGVTVLPGMEVQTREEVHLLTLFEKMRNFVQWCEFIKAHRSPLKNDERKFGAQFVVDEADELVRVEEAMLLASTDLSVQDVAERAAELGGLAIAAHVDRPAFSLLSQLGLFRRMFP